MADNPATSSAGGGGNSATPPGAVVGVDGAIKPPFPNAPEFQPAPATLRRLTRPQFRNALRDLLGTQVEVDELGADDWTGGFATIGASVVSTSDRGVEQFHAVIDQAVNAVFADAPKRAALIGCTPGGTATDPCMRSYIQAFGRRAWRRPLEAEKIDRLSAIAAQAAADLGNPMEGARWATVAILRSPLFLYRPELGAVGANGPSRLNGYEMASRLAFLIWNSVPDPALLEQAADGTLDAEDGVRAAATRLLDAPGGREAVAAFADEHMRLDRLMTQAKDPGLFPDYTPSLQAAMVRDMRETWASVAFDRDASALDLFTTADVVVNDELARLYGIDAAGLTPVTFQARALPADGPRLGILGKAGFLSQWANQREGSPTLRGKSIRESFMCGTVPPPPANVNTVLEDAPAGQHLTKRERLESHRTQAACAGCHALMDPIGLPFENFDAIGRYRMFEDTLPINPSGELNGRPVADSRALGQVLASDPLVAQCLVRKYYAYAVGHQEREVDGRVLNTLVASFQTSGFKLRQLVLDIVSSEAFTRVAPQL